MARRVKIVGAPGYGTFEATVVPGLDRVPAVDARGELAVVVDDDDWPVVVPSSTVHDIS